jgi:hypothetical protein
VGEVEAVVRALDHPASYEFLKALRRGGLVGSRRSLEERKLELASDHGRHSGELTPAIAQSPETILDEIPNALGQRQGC